MKLLEGESFYWNGERYLISCRDEDSLILKQLDTSEKSLVSLAEIQLAYRNLEIAAVSLEASLEHANSLADLPPNDPNRPVIIYRKHYVTALCKTPLSVKGQNERLAALASAAGHKRVPGASTVRRWFSRYIQGGDLGLADMRRYKSIVCKGMHK